MSGKSDKTPMLFRNFGGVCQFLINNAEDLAQIDRLDAARWAATSAPTVDLRCDPAFLAYIDPEKTGRIRVSHVLAARDWTFRHLAGRERLAIASETLMLNDLDHGREARALREAALRIIKQESLPTPDRITLQEVRNFRALYVRLLENGDGLVPPEVIPDPDVAAFARDLLSVVGGRKDALGLSGIGEEELVHFLARARAWLEWRAETDLDGEILVWGAETADASGLVEALNDRIEEYFWHCDLLRQTSVAPDSLRPSDEEVRLLAGRDTGEIERYLAGSPLAAPRASALLNLDDPVNPIFHERLEALTLKVLRRALGPDITRLSRMEWRRVKELFARYRAWMARKPAEPFENLGEARVRAMLEGPEASRLSRYIALDKAAARELLELEHLEKLILMQRWLIELANNFVNFSILYTPGLHALIEQGSLVIDGRRLDLVIKIRDREAHRKVANESQLFLVYAAIHDKDGEAADFEVVAPVTSGERGRLRVGKRGIFIDLAGQDWEAIVTDIVENPISLTEAIRAPFRRASQFISKKIEEIAASQLEVAEKTSGGTLGQGVIDVSKRVQGAPGAVKEGIAGPPGGLPGAASGPVPVGMAAGAMAGAAAGGPVAVPGGGLLAGVAPASIKTPKVPGMAGRELLVAGGVAVAALGSAAAYIVSAISNVKPLNALAAVASVILLVAALSGFMGWLKLRKRDLSLVFEANGWAVNMRMKMNRRLGKIFTRIPPLPQPAIIDRRDALRSLAEENTRRSAVLWWFWLFMLIALTAYYLLTLWLG